MTTEPLEVRWSDQLFAVRKSVRYHNRRRMFFERIGFIKNFLGLFFGSAAVISALGSLGINATAIFAGIVATVSAVDLVIGSGQLARLHLDLARRFINLERAFVEAEPDEPTIRKLMGERLVIEADEPPAMRVLDCLCHNEMVRAMGWDQKAECVPISLTQRLLAQIIDWRASTLNKGEAA